MDRTETTASRPPELAEAGVGGGRVRWDELAAQARALVQGLDPDVVPAGEAVELWGTCGEIARCFTSAQLLLARRVADAGVYKEAGARDTAEYLALRSGVSRASMSQILATSQRLASQPVTDAAVRGGVLSVDQAHVIADAAAVAPDRAEGLVDYARARSLKELRDEALRAKAVADPSPEATRKRQHAERHFRSGTGADGRWWFKGQGPPEDRARFDAALAPLIEDQFHYARAEGRQEPRDALVYDAVQDMAHRAHHTNHHGPSTNHGHSDDNGTTSTGEHGDERCGGAQSSDHSDETTRGTPADDTAGAGDTRVGHNDPARPDPAERHPDPGYHNAAADGGAGTPGGDRDAGGRQNDLGASRPGDGDLGLAGNGDAGADGGAGTPGGDRDAGGRQNDLGASRPGQEGLGLAGNHNAGANSSPAARGTGTPGGDGGHEQTGTGGAQASPRGERRQAANGGMEPHCDGGYRQTDAGESPSSPSGERRDIPGQDSDSESARSTRRPGSAGPVNDPFLGEVDDQAGAAAGLADPAVQPERRRRRRPGLSLLAVLRVDLAALQRGYLLAGELCEITSNGPLTLAAARELLAESVVKLVLTRYGEVTTVAHMGRSSPTPTQLAILHVEATALTPTAAATAVACDGACCHIAGIGVVDRSAARELLGQLDEADVLERVLTRGRDVANLAHVGRQPTVAQRTALLWAQPTCSVQGCAHTFTQIDHRHEWHKQNQTELANLDRLCTHHHRLKTTRNYQLVPGTGDRPFVSPHDPRHPDSQQDTRHGRAPPHAA